MAGALIRWTLCWRPKRRRLCRQRCGDWLRATALAENPDALHRLVEAFTGDHLSNHATVLFSMRPGRAWGWKSAKAGSWLRGGHLEGTHGGLDRGSSVGFFLPDRGQQGKTGLFVHLSVFQKTDI